MCLWVLVKSLDADITIMSAFLCYNQSIIGKEVLIMENLKQEYIKLANERTYLMETAYLYPGHYEKIEVIDKKIENIKRKMMNIEKR